LRVCFLPCTCCCACARACCCFLGRALPAHMARAAACHAREGLRPASNAVLGSWQAEGMAACLTPAEV
jgi:hypothetical protein